jgi:hypothetical protein
MTKYLQPKQLSVKKSFRRYLIVPLLSLAFLFTVVTHAVAQKDSSNCSFSQDKGKGITTINKWEITTIAITPEQFSLQVNCKSASETVTLSVQEPKLQAFLLDFSDGDLVNLGYNDNTKELTSLSVSIKSVGWFPRLATILGSGVALYFITLGIVAATKNNLNDIFVGQDKRLSNSKSQMAIWFFVVIVSYISFNVLRAFNGGLGFVGGISIPENLLVLSGLSAVTYGGAKVITQSQVNSKPGSKPEADKASPADFVTDDDGNTDFGDLQMSFITLLAVVVYLLQFFDFLGTLELQHLVTLPDVDTTILSVFGFSQGAYLTKKTAQATGAKEPVQFEKGMMGKNVKQLKELLSRNLEIPLSNNDEFDDDTEKAVRQFQVNYNLDSTGIVDRETYKKILLS